MAQSITILTNTDGRLNVTGEAFRADGYFGLHDGLHTVSFHLQNFTGRIFVEASLANEPTESDWFPIYLTVVTPYVQYPRNPGQPTGSIGATGVVASGDTTVEAFSFRGNFMYLRVRIDRSYIYPEPLSQEAIAAQGVVKKVLLNY